MSAREIATLWIIALAGVFVIILDHRMQAGQIMAMLGGSRAPIGGADNPILPGAAADVGIATTNDVTPSATGNARGIGALWANPPTTMQSVFGSIWDDIGSIVQ